MGQQNSQSNLFIKITLGETQSHELFDFQNGGIEQQQKIVKSPSFLITKGESFDYLQQQNIQDSAEFNPQNIVYKITSDQYQQLTIKDLGNLQNRALWRIIKSNEAYPLKPGDMLKIGKIKIQLKKIVQRKQQGLVDLETVKGSQQDNIHDDLQSVNSNHSNCDRCKICFGSYNNKTDPLLCLCKCSGSIKYIHFMCLRDWISHSVSKRQDQNCKFYTYQQTCCELCKNTLPNQFSHNGKNFSLFDFSSFQPPYAQFEYSQVENEKKKFYKYVINLSKDKEVLIGRNNSSQVVMKDISISRTHCSLQYKQGLLLLRDKKSKFGTLIKVDKSLQFNSENGLQLQYQSKIIELYKKNTLKGCCCSEIDNYKVNFQYEAYTKKNRINNNNLISNGSDLVGLDIQNQRSRQLNLNRSEPNQIIRMSSDNQSSEGQSIDSFDRLVNQGLQQGENENNERDVSARDTMIRATMARDGDIRYF